MLRLVRSILLLGAFAAAARAQSASAKKSAASPDPAVTLLRLEDTWAIALIKRDGATFQRLLAPGFIYTEDDRVSSRDDVLKDVVSGTDTVTAAHNEGMEVHLFGPTGVVTGWLIVKGRGKSGPFEHRYRFTDTWANRNGEWQIVAAQDYVKPKARV
jgi:hypothetical protein